MGNNKFCTSCKYFEKSPDLCGMNGDFSAKDKHGNIIYDKDGKVKRMSSAKCYAWFVWKKGNYNNSPVVGWINT